MTTYHCWASVLCSCLKCYTTAFMLTIFDAWTLTIFWNLYILNDITIAITIIIAHRSHSTQFNVYIWRARSVVCLCICLVYARIPCMETYTVLCILTKLSDVCLLPFFLCTTCCTWIRYYHRSWLNIVKILFLLFFFTLFVWNKIKEKRNKKRKKEIPYKNIKKEKKTNRIRTE